MAIEIATLNDEEKIVLGLFMADMLEYGRAWMRFYNSAMKFVLARTVTTIAIGLNRSLRQESRRVRSL